jgi:hypothetical protein
MSQLARKYEEQQGGGGGMLGTSEEAQRFGEQTFETTERGAGLAPAGGGTGAGGVGAGAGRSAAAAPEEASAEPSTASKMSLSPFADAPSGVKRVLSAVGGVLAARDMRQLCGVVGPAFARDVVCDGPLALLHRKGELRVASYASGLLFDAVRFEPAFCEFGTTGPGTQAVEAVGTLVLSPRRTILVPPTLLLPREVRLRATVTAGVRGDLDSGAIDFLRLRAQNLPVAPAFLRSAVGGTLASAAHAAEPVWGQLAWAWGDHFYAERARRQQAARAAGGAFGGGGGGGGGYGAAVGAGGGRPHPHGGGIVGAAHDASNQAIDYGSAFVSRAAEYVGYFAATARHAAEAVLPEALVPHGGGGAGGAGGAGGGGGGFPPPPGGAGSPTASYSPVGGGGGMMGGGMMTGAGTGGGPRATTTATGGGGLAGAARDVAAKGADVARGATGGGGGGAGGKTGPSYAAVAAPESAGARRREHAAAVSGY